MESKILRFKISPQKLVFLKFLLESLDHLALLTILEPKIAFCSISFYPTEESLIREILTDFEVEFLEKGS